MSKKELLMQSLTKFFNDKNNYDIISIIISGKSNISLRILDWFVTNFSKKNGTFYEIEQNNNIKNFIVYLDYKTQLKVYSKKQFDPFCRRARISFRGHDDQEIITTVGQLNFFRWAIDNNIINYIIDNYSKIEGDMTGRIKQQLTPAHVTPKVPKKRGRKPKSS